MGMILRPRAGVPRFTNLFDRSFSHMADIAFEKDLSVAETGIGGLKVVDLAVHGDSRGWFKENWQRAKMCGICFKCNSPL